MPTGKDLLAQMQNISILPNSLAFWGMGQMGIAIKGPDAIIYIDACLSDVVRQSAGDWWYRAYPPPLEPTDLSNGAYFLTSHEHMDHLDPMTLGPAAKVAPKAKFIVTGWSVDMMAEVDIGTDRLIIPQVNQTITLPGTSIRLTTVASAHYAVEQDAQKGYRWFGFLIEWNGVVFYHSGDTIIYPGYVDMLRGLPLADVAMLAVNGRDWIRETSVGAIGNLLPDEAAYLAKEIGWDTLIPGHNDLYPNNALPMGHIVESLAKIAPRQKYKILQPGELLYYVK
jgi:L-ascorbate metabolism protein UlaG (beta-lactamase superfamily)